MSVHVALLRGINLGNRRVPMPALAALFEAAKCRAVRTYIQSGNVVFETSDQNARTIGATIERALADAYGFESPVVTRSAAELRAIARANPYLGAGADEKALHVAFLAARPEAARVAALDPARSPPDTFTVRGREIYLFCPNGLARTKLTNQYFDSKLGTVSTVRNWNTVRALLELSGATT